MCIWTEFPQIEAIYESAPVGLCVLDRELRYVLVNDRLAAMNRRQASEHIGRTVRELLPGIAEQAERLLRPVIAGSVPSADVEMEAGERAAVLHCLPLRDPDGSIVALNIAVDDITERKRTERALRDSEARFHALADNIAQLAWMADETGSIFWYNRRWFEYTGTSLEEMRGGGWQKVHHPDYVPGVVERLQRCFATGEPWEDTCLLRSRDGVYRWFLGRALPIRDERGHITLWFGTHTDVTEQRRAEEALLEADRRKDQFMVLLGHELRNPLAPILTAAALLQARDRADQALQKAAATIVRQTRQLARLVDDLLDVGRITTGKLRLERRPVEIATILTQALETSAPAIEGRRHRIDVSRPAEPIYVDVDAARIVQVICNLLDNAAKYMEPGGRIEVAVSEEAGTAVIRVRDKGIGIPLEMLRRIFQRFVQVGAAARRADGGLGLGLSLVKSLVEMHGGSVEARSAGIGQGSEFIVRLPALSGPGA